ncbi:phosphoribosylformylglycinamidine synthase subunit PurS [Periweissella fabalis]|uniref:Phosphoribosylformylglycinamidine synthase subunit PurS n=1 Tax=Periweissella fabalis TaxID=1070421 RepID=A0A7X6S3X2_9LACO|nr:phosphoribosylformylglycinamidine synthase subunit PurS [Periweissella fabalis]MCM0598180.1 phosphoribosylformylglycinamidine synthase subunit PurS [Periweissella fabalis]NKZ24696.1 phosphoribosylformylglycinamidine synthase subunit PurS [Periweissella fabalis]
MFLAKIYVTYKPSILDPKGETVKDALQRMEYTGIEDVVMGKYFEIKLSSSDATSAAKEVESFSEKLLINVNMEVFRYEIEAITE